MKYMSICFPTIFFISTKNQPVITLAPFIPDLQSDVADVGFAMFAITRAAAG